MQKERFIPYRKADIVKMCIGLLPDKTLKKDFNDFCALLVNRIHYQYHAKLEFLKENYAPFDPNRDTRALDLVSAEQNKLFHKKFGEEFAALLDSANYEKITTQDLKDALEEESLFKVRLEVTFEDFEEVVFYRRGESIKSETLLTFFGLRKQNIEFTNYERVAVYITFKDKEYFDRINKVPTNFVPGSTIVKLFQNVPKADLEMLFPNSEVRMRPIDKFIIGASAAVGGIAVLVTKLGASLILLLSVFLFWVGWSDREVEVTSQHLMTFGIGMGVFGSFVFREWTKFKNRKIRFMKALSDNLYFKNLDNNAGVFHTLLDAAEEEDCKEALLAYTFLLPKYPDGLCQQALDTEIEDWFEQANQCGLDFDVTDAIEKLLEMNLISWSNDKYFAIPVKDAVRELDEYWDNLYK